jgi:2-oxoglutarate dehydrogenase complex dehydrogenase (E1) component-like enzyme
MLRISTIFKKVSFEVMLEPQNMGAYSFVQPRLDKLLPSPLKYHGRKPLAAPATGIGSQYKIEQSYCIDGIFDRIE